MSLQCPTSIPFLYQTKTLSTLLFCPARAYQPQRLGRRTFHASIAGYNHDHSWRPELQRRGFDTPWSNGKDTALLRGVLRYVTNQRRVDDIPWEGDLNGKEGPQTQTCLSAAQRGSPAAEGKNIAQNTNHSEEKGRYNASRLPRASTITVTEKTIFDHIFEDISKHTKRGKSFRAGKAVLTISSNSAGGAPPLEPYSESNSPKEIMDAIGRYPPSLRAAAARAVGLISDQGQEQRESRSETNESEEIRQKELQRVEAMMRAALTDVELWQVMEKEVFSLIERLGLEETPSVHKGAKPSRGRRKGEDVEASRYPTNSENESLDLTTYGSLYPSHLLLGLKLLDLSFAKPSLLALNVLPRIKSLGLISHVLGASAALYNELLRIYCFRYENYIGAIDLLVEMEQGGLEFDTETLAVVDRVNEMQHNIIRGNSGPSLKALWSLPEFAPGKFKEWKAKIQVSIDQGGPLGYL